ncbi:MAG: hypothetical protein AAGG81_05620, partial [Chlamydiota bacterium]
PTPPYTKRIEKLNAKLKKESAYQYLLSEYLEIFETIAIKEKIFLRCHAAKPDMKQLEIDFNSIIFFKKQVERHLSIIKRVLSLYNKPTLKPETFSNPNGSPIPQLQEDYQLEKEYRIDGSILCFRSFKQGKLHGPVTYYGRDGKCLAYSFYDEGKRKGRAQSYDSNGTLISIDNYDEDVLSGEQLSFYEDVRYKSIIPLLKGKLNGDVRLFHPNGSLKRIVQFDQGMLNGIEKYWGRDGLLLWECQYEKGHPIGTARSWYLNGVQATECTYNKNEGSFFLKEWNENGKLVYQKNNIIEDEERHDTKLKEAIEKFEKEIHTLYPNL